MALADILGLPKHTGIKFGIECEVEGTRLPPYINDNINCIEDGSLRGGYEYVFTAPLTKNESIEQLNALFEKFKAARSILDYSFRTSTHVHVNVSDLSLRQINNIIFLYSIMEDLFVNFCNENRRGNRFALRFKEAANLYSTLRNLVAADHIGDQRSGLGRLNQNELKYSALNMYTLVKYGTLEFRSLEGTNDLAKISKWLDTIENLVNVAKSFKSMEELHETFLNDPESMVDAIFVHNEFKFPGWRDSVELSFSQSYPIVLTSKGMI